ncbi:hypothetical protein GF351_04665 [Candidatus Woesearchaeota archaeon]|nr:hypothetical protein [Candidatus Woesearchaeota archaeon]
MKESTGFEYSYHILIFKQDYGTLHYRVKDLESIGAELVKKLKTDKDYFDKVKAVYDKQVKTSHKLFQEIDNTDFSKLTDEQRISLLKKATYEAGVSVGIGHIIEPFALVVDIQIKQELSRYIKDPKELNTCFSLLMSPVKRSFVNEYEESLRRIASADTEDEKKRLMEQHLKRFFWIRNTYSGRVPLTEADVEDELKAVKNKGSFDPEKFKEQKEDVMSKLNMDEELVNKIKAMELIAYWQDERKKNTLIALDYLERVLESLAEREQVSINYLRYLQLHEIDIGKVRMIRDLLIQRRDEGCAVLLDYPGSECISGKDYEEYVSKLEKEKESEIKEITGTTASAGTAIGPVKILTTAESMKKLEEGDVLVASMTRPELVPAMKRACAVITDEGGITCHAAIVSRELGIPCIIGTKIATKVLKDGDLIEVKANHGLVIVLKREE